MAALPSAAGRLVDLPPRNPHFAGRTGDLAQLDTMFAGGAVAVHGLGGIGKSQLAQEYAHSRRDQYRIVWWVRARHRVEVTTDLTRLGRALGLEADAAPEQVIMAVRAELADRNDWLLVFDDISDVDDIRDLIPIGPGDLLITSRIRYWIGLAQARPLAGLPPDEAVRYLRASTDREAPEAAELARELGYLPLALAQAAGYVTAHGCSVTRYLELYRSAAQRILRLGPRPGGYPATVATTWLLHFESLSSAAIEVLRLVAFVAPDVIPLPMLLDAAAPDHLPEALREAAGDPVGRETAIGELVNTSLIDRIDDDTVRVHMLVQEVTRSELPKKEAAIWLRRTIAILGAAFPDEPWFPENWPKATLLTPHAQAAGMRVQPHQTKLAYPAAQLLETAGSSLDARGYYEEARPILAHAMKLAAANSTGKRLGEAHVLTTQAGNLLHLQDLMSALHASNEALRIIDSVLRPVNPMATRTLGILANIAMTIEDYPGAIKRLDRALLNVRTFGEQIPGERRYVQTMLGRALARTKDFSRAQEHLEQALADARSSFGPEHVYVADVLYALAELAKLRGDTPTAETRFREAYAMFESLYGPDHPSLQLYIDQFTELGDS